MNHSDRENWFGYLARFWLFTVTAMLLQGCAGPTMETWHTVRLTEEFTEDQADEIKTFTDYLALEERLFEQLEREVYDTSATGFQYRLHRYSPGSAADPRQWEVNWNRSFELASAQPRGGVLMIHGMSDSPYAMHTLGLALNRQGYHVVGMRMPGHGTAPSGLRFISREDMAAAVRIGMSHLEAKLGDKPVHMVGYSTGAPLALEFALDALEGRVSPVPASLALVSPAIGIHGAAGMASFKDSLSIIPGMASWSYLAIQDEFDPFKYNSFATNAADVVHRLTRSVAQRLRERASANPEVILPPTLVLKSTVDATVTTDAVVDDLLQHLHPNRHELVLFDINRRALAGSRMLVDDPAPLTDRVMDADNLPFAVTLITNKDETLNGVASVYKQPFDAGVSESVPLQKSWPAGIISLSHVALPFAPDDALYGQFPPQDDNVIFLGQMAIQGERGLLRISTDYMLRVKYNPFFDYLETRLIDWVAAAEN